MAVEASSIFGHSIFLNFSNWSLFAISHSPNSS